MQSSPAHGGPGLALGALLAPLGVQPIWPGKQLAGGGSAVTGGSGLAGTDGRGDPVGK
ncbi:MULTISPECIES: hypothetical protein [Amycolatopsis]|uniref:hypothetical protein n=1 Tax=Amycolatopsis TaxID=1813 RepID=UPI0015A62CDD|nr:MULTISPECIES: hypothetical protein [Amycolatopsis]